MREAWLTLWRFPLPGEDITGSPHLTPPPLPPDRALLLPAALTSSVTSSDRALSPPLHRAYPTAVLRLSPPLSPPTSAVPRRA